MRPVCGPVVLLALFALAAPALADEARAIAAAEKHVAAHGEAVAGERRGSLGGPNVAASEADIRANAALLVRMLEKRGITARVLETPGTPAAVYGELASPGAKRTILFYAHFDGQPVSPE